jgi:hypothetical protein
MDSQPALVGVRGKCAIVAVGDEVAQRDESR